MISNKELLTIAAGSVPAFGAAFNLVAGMAGDTPARRGYGQLGTLANLAGLYTLANVSGLGSVPLFLASGCLLNLAAQS